jgi:hypothetical protein
MEERVAAGEKVGAGGKVLWLFVVTDLLDDVLDG